MVKNNNNNNNYNNKIRVIDWNLQIESISLTKCFGLTLRQDKITTTNILFSETNLEDPSTKRMKYLAKRKYGIDSKHNATLLKDRPSLQRVWIWISRLGKIPASQSGVREILSKQKNESKMSRWMAFNVFESPERSVIHRIFGWATESSDVLKNMMNEIERQHDDFDRSAALALFHGNLELAVNALQRGISVSLSSSERGYRYSMVLMVLVGYGSNLTQLRDRQKRRGSSSDGNNDENEERVLSRRIWMTQKMEVTTQLAESSPYLHAMCQFLKLPDHIEYFGEQESNAGLLGVFSVLRSSKIRLADKICIACRYLQDDTLKKYLNTELAVSSEIVSDKIQALVFLGLGTPAGLDLLQRYLDRTADIQTVALFGAMLDQDNDEKKQIIENNNKTSMWLKEYRELLNSWRMWQERASLDIAVASSRRKHHVKISTKLPLRMQSQIHPVCTNCNNSLYPLLLQKGTGSVMTKTGTSGMHWIAQQKMERRVIRLCPHCKKEPLPRCSVCLEIMGMSNPQCAAKLDTEDWWSWCRHCNHGGHLGHLKKWFDRNRECPVAGCHCMCQLRDRATTTTTTTLI